jgi:hypothetical protein
MATVDQSSRVFDRTYSHAILTEVGIPKDSNRPSTNQIDDANQLKVEGTNYDRDSIMVKDVNMSMSKEEGASFYNNFIANTEKK